MTASGPDRDLQEIITSEFTALTAILGSATEVQWDTPSLCEGWRVREVIAHLTMPVRYSDEQFMKELEACGFDFGALSNKVAARDAQLPVAILLDQLAAPELHRWTPPAGGQHGALNHVVVHGLDVTVPLSPQRVPGKAGEAVRIVLDDLTLGGVHAHFGTSIEGLRLEATDFEWSYGVGPTLRGPAREIILVLCGRTFPDLHLEGPPIH